MSKYSVQRLALPTCLLIFSTCLLLACANPNSQLPTTPKNPILPSADTLPEKNTSVDWIKDCVENLKSFPGPFPQTDIEDICAKTQLRPTCISEKQSPIFHYDRKGSDPSGKNILAISLIHGDEMPAGSVARAWMSRLNTIDPRNTWRVIPLVNPDGYKARTRYNKNNVDINRNFPSKDWNSHALKYWLEKTNQDKRRYPGDAANSERETQCIVQHIDDFKPDFVISIHTPLGVLDFDGPKIGNPGFKPLPWVALGNFPGSLGRYMWIDKNVPVLTIELRGNSGMRRLEEFDQLQDITGTVAIQAGKMLQKKME